MLRGGWRPGEVSRGQGCDRELQPSAPHPAPGTEEEVKGGRRCADRGGLEAAWVEHRRTRILLRALDGAGFRCCAGASWSRFHHPQRWHWPGPGQERKGAQCEQDVPGDVCCDGKAFGMKGKKEDNALPTNIHENWGTWRNGANLAHRALKCSRQVGPAHRWPLAIAARCLAPSYTIAQHQHGRRLLLDRIALARTGR